VPSSQSLDNLATIDDNTTMNTNTIENQETPQAANPDEVINPLPAFFNRFELELPEQAVADIARPGKNDEAAAYWATRVPRPEACDAETLRDELAEHGAWDDEQLSDDAANWHRIIWIAAHNIKEEMASAD